MTGNETAPRRWYLVYCKPRQETVAQENLQRQGYETYLPRLHEARRRQGRRLSVIAPMFPRYLFVHLNTQTDTWGPIRSTIGIVSIVRFGRAAAHAPDSLIQILKDREDAEGIQILPPDEYKPGSKVRITHVIRQTPLADVALLADSIQQIENQLFFPVRTSVHVMNTISRFSLRQERFRPNPQVRGSQNQPKSGYGGLEYPAIPPPGRARSPPQKFPRSRTNSPG